MTPNTQNFNNLAEIIVVFYDVQKLYFITSIKYTSGLNLSLLSSDPSHVVLLIVDGRNTERETKEILQKIPGDLEGTVELGRKLAGTR